MLDSISSILNSASKIVFIMLTVTVCAAFLYAVAVGRITIDQDKFWMVVIAATTYYFTYKPQDIRPQNSNLPMEAVK